MATPEQLLRKLDERFILGEIGDEQYQQMRQRLQAQIDEASAVRIDTGDADHSTTPPGGVPFDKLATSPAHAGGMEISDSVIKGNVTSGSASVGNININVGQGTAGGSSAELEYEKCVMMTLRSGGSLESIRRELDDRRMAIGLPIRLAREIEEACLASCGRKPIQGRVPTAGPAGPDPLTRFFKSASVSIASMFSNARHVQPAPPSNRPTPVPPIYPPALHQNGKGGPPPVPWLAPPQAAAVPASPAAVATPAAAEAASVKEALKEELRDGLRAELAHAAEKDAAHESAGSDKPAKAEPQAAPVPRKPPPLPPMPPPLQWPGKPKAGK